MTTLVKESIEISFHFFELVLTPYNERGETSSNALIKEVFEYLLEERKQNRVHVIDRKEGEANDDKRNLLLLSTQYTEQGKRLKGKIALLRDKLPVFLNNRSDIDEIENFNDKRLAELTHFCIDFQGPKPLVMYEFNSNGPRISDLEYYIRQIAKKANIAKFCTVELRVIGEVESILQNLVNVAEIDLKVKPHNASFLKDVDNNYYTAVTALNNSYPYEAIRVSTSFSRKKINVGALSLARNLLTFVKKDVLKDKRIDGLKMNVDKGNGFEVIDLIRQKECRVLEIILASPGRPDSKDMYYKALLEMNNYLKE